MSNELKYDCECGYNGTGDTFKSVCPDCGNMDMTCTMFTDTVAPSDNTPRPYTPRIGWNSKLNRDYWISEMTGVIDEDE